MAAPAVFTPAIIRLQQGQSPIPPDATLTHAADMLRMLRDQPPTAEQAAALDRYLVTASDHGLNASTFVARVIASTRAGLASATLGSNERTEGPTPRRSAGTRVGYAGWRRQCRKCLEWLQSALDRGERLMGFGHRVYRVRDPRADAIKEAIQRLARAGQVDQKRFKLAEAVETAALELLARKKPDRPLQTNLEFYTALLLEGPGLPTRSIHVRICSGPCRRLDRSRPRAAVERPTHSPAITLRGAATRRDPSADRHRQAFEPS